MRGTLSSIFRCSQRTSPQSGTIFKFQHLLVQEMLDEACEQQQKTLQQRMKILGDDHKACQPFLDDADTWITKLNLLQENFEKYEKRKERC